MFSSKLVSNVLKVDDPLDAAAVHGFCGAWGLIAAALFAAKRHLAASYSVEHDNYGAPLLQDVARVQAAFAGMQAAPSTQIPSR